MGKAAKESKGAIVNFLRVSKRLLDNVIHWVFTLASNQSLLYVLSQLFIDLLAGYENRR